jgi:hypothetical protein
MFDLLRHSIRRRARGRATGAAANRAPGRGGRPGRAWLALAAAGALVLALGAGSAAAAPASLLPSAWNPQVALDAAGDAVAVWEFYDGAHWIVQTAARPVGGAWQASVNLSTPGQDAREAHVAIGPAGDAVAVWRRSNGANWIVQTATRPVGGAWQAPVDLSAPGRDADQPRVAIGTGGLAYAVWTRLTGPDSDHATSTVQAAARPTANSAWQAPVDLSAPGQVAWPPHVAIDPAGDAVAVWDRYNGANWIVQAAARSALAVTRFWQPPVDLSAPGQNADDMQVAIESAGKAVAVWERFNGASEMVQAATRPAASGAWQAPVDLSAPGRDADQPRVAIGPAGLAIAVWEDGNFPNSTVQAAARPAGAAWQPPVTLSPPRTANPQVVITAGLAIAVWEDANGTDWTVQAATRPAASGAWQTPITLSAADQNNALSPQVALDSAGDALAVWQCDGFTFPAAVRAAARPAASGAWQAPVDLSAPGCVATAHVPDVVGWSKRAAGPRVSAAGLVARFTGATTATNAYVATETPAPDTRVPRGSTVTMYLKPGSAP